MKGFIKGFGALFGIALVAVGALAAHTWTADKPLRFEWFLERLMLKYALQDPELLTQLRLLEPLGIKGHNGRLTDASLARQAELNAAAVADLARLRAYDRAALSPERQLSYDITEWFIQDGVEGQRWQFHFYPVNPLFGVQSELPTLLAVQQQVDSAEDAERYLARLAAFGVKFDQVLEGLEARVTRNILPQQFAVQKTLKQMREFIAVAPEQNLLHTALAEKLGKIEGLPEASRDALLARAREEIERTVYPAYGRLIAFFERIEPRATTNDGAWSLPDGEAYYAWRVRSNTTSDLTPDQVHELGLAEVARIEAEMDAILKAQGYAEGSVGARMTALGSEPRFNYEDSDAARAQIIADYQKHIDEISGAMPQYFALLPKSGVEVKRVPEFKQASAPGAYYDAPPLDGSRPGVFWINLRNVAEIQKFGMRTLAYHEATPGHHFQIAIAQELEGVPTIQKVLPFTAYAEGWALYTERLAKEIGFQEDPFDDLGRLQAEQFRAVRLVVDSGMHHRRWTREQAIAYMIDKTGMPETDVVAEIERYLVWPGQALAYKVGMNTILDLRAEARQRLGERFDLKAFHSVVLSAGSMPLGILRKRVEGWIAEQGG